MISFEEALTIVLNSAILTDEETVSLDHCTGRVLSRDVFSDMDMPPFHKSAVDGFACRMEDIRSGIREFRVIETIAAGGVPEYKTGPGTCSRIMTGGMLPDGADVVIMVEDTRKSVPDMVTLLKEPTGANICVQAEDIKSGEKVLDRGTRITPAHVAVLASVGETSVWVARQPEAAVISTGNEIIEPGRKPGKAQIRDSNSGQLMAQVRQVPSIASYLGIAGDTPGNLREIISSGLNSSDIILLTGGVSMGDFDYVPAVMEALDAEILFKSIAIQPGRPTVFARISNKFIFGLPGNPVSSFVLFELLVKPFILKMMGCDYKPLVLSLPLGVGFSRKKSGRKSVIPVRIDDGLVFPVEYHGSAHINAYTKAGAMMIMDIGQTFANKGDLVHVRPL